MVENGNLYNSSFQPSKSCSVICKSITCVQIIPGQHEQEM